MPTRYRALLSLSVLVSLAGCGGDKDGATTALTATNSSGNETGPGPTTGGLSMSSDPTASSQVTGDATSDATGDVTTGGPMTTPTSATTVETTDAVTSDATSTSTGDPEECLIDQPRPGSCDGGKPKQPVASRITSTLPSAAGPRGPKQIVDKADDEQFATTGCSFICEPDAGDTIECDIFAQDCGPGEKCNAWADNGGSSWNATKCVPVDADPDLIGEPCTAEGGGVSGIDSCAKGAMCFGIGDDEKGTCVEMCSCTPDNPVCTTQNTTCTISNDGVLALCLPVCDPLDVGACGAGDVCLAAGGSSQLFICVVDASGDQGAVGDNCQFQNGCDPGMFCASNTGVFPGCDDIGCCTPFCDLGAAACPGGTSCAAWFEEGTAPKCFEDVGACI